MGGTHHPFLGLLGVMSAKNTAVNLMILTTFLSFVLYRRANRISTRSWAGTGMLIQWAVFGRRRGRRDLLRRLRLLRRVASCGSASRSIR